jgi:hypothetical protein
MAMMGYREYGRHRGVALRAVQKAIEAGRIRTVMVGVRAMIDSDQADRDWQSNTDPLMSDPGQQLQLPAAALPAARPAASAAMASPKDAAPAAEPEDSNEFREQRIREMRARADNAELDLAERRGDLVSVTDQELLTETCWRIKRDRDNMIGARLAPALISQIRSGGDDIAALTFAVEQLINAEVREAHRDALEQIKAIKLDDDEAA